MRYPFQNPREGCSVPARIPLTHVLNGRGGETKTVIETGTMATGKRRKTLFDLA
jgi:hypothetical protein